jgi:anti-sigma regulatory factor (Ser/Thr protein kinase)
MTREHSATFPPALEAPALARHELERWLPETLSEGDRGALRLLVSELVTNSVRHAAANDAPVALSLRIAQRTVRVEVHDGGHGFDPGTPTPRSADAGYGGYGLFLVERMASRWGVNTGAGTMVWFELDLAAAPG